MERYDAAVIGAGVLGGFAARALTRYALRVCVLEQAPEACSGVSRANAAIVYPGYDVLPDTLKARLCVPACEEFPALCDTLGVRFSRCGSLLVCFGPEGERTVREKLLQGQKNGVAGLEMLSGGEILTLEPGLRRDVRMGLLAPGAGTVEPWELGTAACENARDNGAEFFFDTEVSAIRKADGGFYLETARGEFFARSVVNCAGLRAAKLRETLLPPAVGIRSSVTDFAVFDMENYVNHIVFTEEENGQKGLTLIPTINGRLMAEGPLKCRNDDDLARNSGEGLETLLAQCAALLPGFDRGTLLRRFAAVRPNPYDVREPRRRIGSFTVCVEDGLVSFIGIKTPGMTCAERLGRLAAEEAVKAMGGAAENPRFDPVRRPPVRLAGLDDASRAAYARSDGAYGKIVCRCCGVSAGEVRDAIRAGARTLGGIRRYCGAGFGACQGGFCTAEVARMLAQALGTTVEEVLMHHA